MQRTRGVLRCHSSLNSTLLCRAAHGMGTSDRLHHLVYDHDDAVLVAQPAHARQEAGRRRQEAALPCSQFTLSYTPSIYYVVYPFSLVLTASGSRPPLQQLILLRSLSVRFGSAAFHPGACLAPSVLAAAI